MSEEDGEIEVKEEIGRNMAGFKEMDEVSEKQFLADSVSEGEFGSL